MSQPDGLTAPAPPNPNAPATTYQYGRSIVTPMPAPPVQRVDPTPLSQVEKRRLVILAGGAIAFFTILLAAVTLPEATNLFHPANSPS